jgi:hypothetical protein
MRDDLLFEITDGGDGIKIQPTGQPYIDSANSWDKNCLRTLLTIKGGAFRGQYNADFYTFEFEHFKQELRRVYKDLNGKFVFSCRDHELVLKIQGDGNGHFTVDCTAMDHPAFGAELKFQLSFDQTYIPELVNQLNDITKAFPIVGTEFNFKNEY